MSEQTDDGQAPDDWKKQQRSELHSYVWGYVLALLLTLVPFALVHWGSGITRLTIFIVIGVFALVQMLVHFRFFLHIGFHQKREDLMLLLFSGLLLTIMVGGTSWILTSLALRMALPGSH